LLALVERSKEIVLEFTNLHGKIQKMELAGFDARVIFIYRCKFILKNQKAF